MPVVIVTIIAAIAVWVSLALWQGRLLIQTSSENRGCPKCDGRLAPTVPRPDQPPRSYEVRHCTQCHTVTTTVHGSRSAFAYCPSCSQLALELRYGDARPLVPGATPLIEVQEACQICGYRGTWELDAVPAVDDESPPDNVIPFRRRH